MTREQMEQVVQFVARDLIHRAVRHPQAPEGIEFFEWIWVASHAYPEIQFLREDKHRQAIWAEPDDPILAEPVETDIVRPSMIPGFSGEVVVAAPLGMERCAWRVGWHREARKGVLWFANGRPRRKA